MTKNTRFRELTAFHIKKGKKASRNALKKNLLSLMLCWFLTEVVTFAAWGIFVFLDFVGFFLDVPLDFLGGAVAIFIVFPLIAGNVSFSKNVVKGRKESVCTIFEGYFHPKQFWMWTFGYVISLSPTWLLCAVIDVVSEKTEKFFPFLKGDWLIYVSVMLEILLIVALFLALCKSLYFLFAYQLPENVSQVGEIFARARMRYSKRKKQFRRYVFSHFYLIVIIGVSRMLKGYLEAILIALTLGYFVLSVSSFSEGFELKFKKYKSERF